MKSCFYFLLFMCVIMLCINGGDGDDSNSSESNESQSGEQTFGGRGRGNNAGRRGTVNTNRNNIDQQGRGNRNRNQQSRGSNNNNQQRMSNGNNNQQGKGQRTGSKNGKGKQNGGAGGQQTSQNTGAKRGKDSNNAGGTNQQGTRRDEENDKQTTTIRSTQSPSTMLDRNQGSTLGTSNPEGEENNRKVPPCELDCKPNTNPRRRVCGSDGVTYDTFCQLKEARCLNPDLKFVSRGDCPITSDDSEEKTTQRETVTTRRPTTQPAQPPTLPVVVTTRTPSTEMSTTRRATTSVMEENTTTGLVNNTDRPNTTPGITTQAPNPMNMTGNSEVPSEGTTLPGESTSTAMSGTTQPFQVDCPNLCPILRQLVCGTDGTTYQSPCVLQLVACVQNDPTLMVASLGPCPISTLEPISAL